MPYRLWSAGRPGPRYDPELPRRQVDGCFNLLLLCKVHHKLVDDQELTSTADLLRNPKSNHERWVAERTCSADAYARPADDASLESIGTAAIANWREELGRHRMVGDVQPCFTSSGAGFEFHVTDKAVQVASDAREFDAWLDTIVQPTVRFDVFLSDAARDSPIANELRDDLNSKGPSCFMAE